MNRRDFLNRILIAAIASSVPIGRRAYGVGRLTGKKVVVVGAGMAGLSAAAELLLLGAEVEVIEARMRPGGRIWTDRSHGGNAVDLGATWILGADKNPVADLVKKYKLETKESHFDQVALFDRNLGRVSESRKSAMEGKFSALEETVSSLSGYLDEDMSVGAAFSSALEGEPMIGADKQYLDYYFTTLQNEAGADLKNISLLHSGASAPSGPPLLFPGGYELVLTSLVRNARPFYGEKAKKIVIRSKKVKVETNKRKIEADGVIVSVSLGVLKNSGIAFEPSLSLEKQEAIEKLGMGVLNKVVLSYPEVFWPKESDFLGYISDRRSGFAQFLNQYKVNGDPALIGFVSGSFAKDLEAKSDEETTKLAHEVIVQMFGSKTPQPTGSMITRWLQDPFSRGSYSFVRIGATSKDLSLLAERHAGRVLFAGEATTREDYGTVHGAYRSGIRAAREAGKYF